MSVNTKRAFYGHKYPSEGVVVFLSRLYKNGGNGLKALDFGFGAGRHMKLLRDFEFDTYGIDVTEDATDTMEQYFGKIVGRENIVIGDILEDDSLFEKDSFDLILAYSALYNRKYEGMKKATDILSSYLKAGGIMICNFASKNRSEYVNTKEYLGNGVAFSENQGKFMTYMDMQELKSFVKGCGLEIALLERRDVAMETLGGSTLMSDWVCALRKINCTMTDNF